MSVHLLCLDVARRGADTPFTSSEGFKSEVVGVSVGNLRHKCNVSLIQELVKSGLTFTVWI